MLHLIYDGACAFCRRSLAVFVRIDPLFYAPGAAFVGRRLYAWVARNRRQFGCGSDACELPAREVR